MHIILLLFIEKKDYGFMFFFFFQLTSMTMASSMPPQNFMFCHFFLQDEATNKTSLSNQILIHVPSPKPSFKAQFFGFYQRL
jgi:hypothetical protein